MTFSLIFSDVVISPMPIGMKNADTANMTGIIVDALMIGRHALNFCYLKSLSTYIGSDIVDGLHIVARNNFHLRVIYITSLLLHFMKNRSEKDLNTQISLSGKTMVSESTKLSLSGKTLQLYRPSDGDPLVICRPLSALWPT